MSERIGPTGNVCQMCRKPLEQPKVGRLRLTCSNKCRQARYRWRTLGQRKWSDKRVERGNERRRAMPITERRLDKHEHKPVFDLGHGRKLYECIVCSKQTVVNRIQVGGRQRFYCSDKCGDLARNRWEAMIEGMRRANKRGKRIDRRVVDRMEQGKLSPLCNHCRVPFAPNTTPDGERKRGRPRKYCSDACAKREYERRWMMDHWKKPRRHRFYDCVECGTRFDRTDSIGRRTMRFCSQDCSHAFRSRATQARKAMQAKGRTDFKWGVSGHGTAARNSPKNVRARLIRNETARLSSGKAARQVWLSITAREWMGIREVENPISMSAGVLGVWALCKG